MTEENQTDDALDRLSVAPEEREAQDPRQQAGQDKSIEKRLEKNPESAEAQLDRGLDESMDASDPPAVTQPGTSQEPPASSGFDEDAERKLRSE